MKMERCLLVDLESLVEGSDLNLISKRKPSQVPVFNLQKIFSWPQVKMNSALPKMLFCKWLSKKGSQNCIRWFLEKSHRKEKEALSLVKGDFKSWPFCQLSLFLSHHPYLEPGFHLGLPHLHPDGGPWRETKLSSAPVLVLLCLSLSEYHAKACLSGRADWKGAGSGEWRQLPSPLRPLLQTRGLMFSTSTGLTGSPSAVCHLLRPCSVPGHSLALSLWEVV